jgi:hypothetical protein
MCKFDIQRYLIFVMLKCMFFLPILDIIPFQRTDSYSKETRNILYITIVVHKFSKYPRSQLKFLGATRSIRSKFRTDDPPIAVGPAVENVVARATRHPGICTSLHWHVVGVPGSNIDTDVGFPHWGVFSESIQANLRIVSQVIPQLLHSTHFQFRYSLIIFSISVIQSTLRTALLSTQSVNMIDKQTSVPT